MERSPERDAALRAALPHVASLGWTLAALAAGLRDLGHAPAEARDAARSLFPRGGAALVEAWCDLADRDMATAAMQEDLLALRTPARVRRLIAIRLAQAAVNRDAVRRALAVLALPWNAGVALRTAACTADAIWAAAGDRSADFSWYTRRATLASIYGATLAWWLREPAPTLEATMGFLDRLLAGQARIGRLRRGAASRPAGA
ncbi:COQ9 family protein [Roseomonas sp. NAR14]|uniref:COQ9 family protein n=1 Tax=Roseomonas acroporae TaxID=2937791 RepID=A0A9X1Y6K0_9PROT|nr:COQ9 family protein [Roseomonas acroporae]MCK8783140.1 COQ9 family protein [Roseomonas acroporae]